MNAIAGWRGYDMGFDIFLSYSRVDRRVADAFFEAASKTGLSIWYDQLVLGGQDWRQAIVQALEQSKVLVILFSGTSNSSTQLIKELAIADNLGKTVIPVLIEDTEPRGAYLYELASRNWVRLYPDPVGRMDDLVAAVADQIRAPATKDDRSIRLQTKPRLASPASPAAAAPKASYWLPVKHYDAIFFVCLTLIAVLHASGVKVQKGGIQLAGYNIILITIYMLILAVRNARLNRGILSVKSFASYVIAGCLSVPFALLPDRLGGASDADAIVAIGLVVLALAAACVANILQVILRPIFQRLQFRRRIASIPAEA